eukprot:TRINITY_DN3563_c0_g1_i1.p1 TRINITY_DN3563_c0_g1~~TRINITY_DN3563_c0_g1_i1.p1  ORF type:complete len:227 (-),score=57.61 TRINITY_DN3563_c0_g1_i1:13-693(-)
MEVEITSDAIDVESKKMEEEEEELDVVDDEDMDFKPISAIDAAGQSEIRKIAVPAHRMAPLKRDWEKIYTPIVTHMKLQIRMNTKTRKVELKTSPETEDIGSIQKGSDFVKAYMLGFDVNDAIALLRLDDLFLDSFDILDVKQTLKGDNLSRAIGRISGKDGRTKFAIENATRTRIVLADRQVHILGAFVNIKMARDAIGSLIKGSPPGKVYAKLKIISARMSERF